ncbi:MAG: Mur ligase family protein [Candidatus Saccharimonadales bacterium]
MERESGTKQVVTPDMVKQKVNTVFYATRSKLVAARYGNPSKNIRVIAVMGISGKTTTACFIAELLKESDHTVALLTNRGIEIKGNYAEKDYGKDVATLQNILKSAKQKQIEFLVIEVTPRMVDRHIIDGIQIDTVVVTNCDARVEPSIRKMIEKQINYVVLPHYNTTLLQGMLMSEHKIISFGDSIDADSTIDKVMLYRKGTEVRLVIDNQTTIDVATHLVGQANAYNVSAAVATAYVLGVDLDLVANGIARLQSVTSNYEYVSTDQTYDIIVDGADNNESLLSVITSARELSKRRLIAVVASDGMSDDALSAATKLTDRLIVIDTPDQTTTITGAEAVLSAKDATAKALRGAKKGDTVLLIGGMFSVRQSSGKTLADVLIQGAE